MTVPTRRVLFLIADTGGGHRSAANAIQHAMKLLSRSPEPATSAPLRKGRSPGARPHAYASPWEAEIVDAIKEYWRFPLRNGIFLYGPATRHAPRLYGQVFRLTNRTNGFQVGWRLARPFFYQGIVRLLLDTQPDVIVSVHPLLNHVTVDVLRDLGLNIPFITVVTDLVTVHCSWIAPGVTACVVPTESAREIALRGGMPARRIHLLGMPIDPRFSQPPRMARSELRRELGLDPDRPTILLVGGGEGAIGLAEATQAVGHSDLDAQMIVVTGRNETLRAELEQARDTFRTKATILGFVNTMPDMMHAADIIVTKAGPGTITEAMACGLPIILTGAVPGQEEGNVAFVVEHDLGVLARSPASVVSALRGLLEPDSPRLEELRANVRRMSRPGAAFDIAKLIFDRLPPPGAPAVWPRVRRPRAARLAAASGSRVGAAPQGHRGLRPLSPRVRAVSVPMSRLALMTRPLRGRGVGGLSPRPLHVRGRRIIPRPSQLPRLADLASARSLLLRGTQLGKLQLWRPGGRRGRHDAGAPLGRGGR